MPDRFPPAIIAAATASHAKYFPYGPFISITLAQWADESAFGTRPSGKFNFFGIKATAIQISKGNATRVMTKEFIGSQYVTEPLYFADYPDLVSGFDDHAQLLISHHYLACMRAKTPAEYATALHDCGYATEPNYAKILACIIFENSLTQYDKAA